MADPQPRLARSAGVFGLATITSRILGLARDQVLAYYFGAGDVNDAFRVASRIPNLVRDLFAEGAMSAAFVPTFTRLLTLEGRERSWRLASSVINALLIVTGGIVVFGIIFAEPLVRFYAPQYSEVPGKLELTIRLTRIMFPFLVLVSVAASSVESTPPDTADVEASSAIPKAIHQNYDWIPRGLAMQIGYRNAKRHCEVTRSTRHSYAP